MTVPSRPCRTTGKARASRLPTPTAGNVERKRKAARGGDADAHTGERTGAGRRRDSIEISESDAGLGKRRLDHRHQPLRLAAPEPLARSGQRLFVANNRDGAVGTRGVDGENEHRDRLMKRPDAVEAKNGAAGPTRLRRLKSRCGSRIARYLRCPIVTRYSRFACSPASVS